MPNGLFSPGKECSCASKTDVKKCISLGVLYLFKPYRKDLGFLKTGFFFLSVINEGLSLAAFLQQKKHQP